MKNKIGLFIVEVLMYGTMVLIALVILSSCGKKCNKSKSLNPNNYIVCSYEAYRNNCTDLIIDRPLSDYELYGNYCLESYRNCLGRK